MCNPTSLAHHLLIPVQVTKTFRGKTMQGVMVIKEDDEGMFACNKRQKQQVCLTTQLTDQIELRENQAETMFNSAYQQLLSSASTDFDMVMCSLGSDSSNSSTLVVRPGMIPMPYLCVRNYDLMISVYTFPAGQNLEVRMC